MGLGSRLKHALSTIFSEDEDRPRSPTYQLGTVSTSRPDRPTFRPGAERTIVSSIYTRLAVDVASVSMEHVRLNEQGVYKETIRSGLNDCLNVQANIDQQGRHIRRDMAITLFQEGVIAIVPVETSNDVYITGSTGDITNIRVGIVTQWEPEHVVVRVYNEKKGIREDIRLHKSIVAIVENPFYSVMNEPNSTLQRLIRKLSLLDHVDEISSSGKLDLIIQLPYVVKTEARRQQAEQRRSELEDQLKGSTYGIAYADGTEKITQLNRAVENNLLTQVQMLWEQVYNELGLSKKIMDGTADDTEMMNYINRTIEPILDALVEGMIPKFLTKTARTQGQTLMYFQTPFKLIPISQLADLIDVLSRNQVVTPNEIRPTLGLKPSSEPQADQLINSNMPIDKQVTANGNGTKYTVEQVQPLALPSGSSSADEEEAILDAEMAELGIT